MNASYRVQSEWHNSFLLSTLFKAINPKCIFMAKFFISAMLSIVILNYSSAQSVKVSAQVNKAFAEKFPGATQLKWSKENSKEFEAEFKWNNKTVSVNFGLDGTWKETETTISSNELPAVVITAINTKYPGAVITLAEKVEKPEAAYYETEIKIKGKKKELEIASDGRIM